MVLRGMFCLTMIRSTLSLWRWPAMLTRASSASLNCYARNIQSAWGVRRWTRTRGNWENIILLPNTPRYPFIIAVIHHVVLGTLPAYKLPTTSLQRFDCPFSFVMLKWRCYDPYEKCRARKLASVTSVLQTIISANLERKQPPNLDCIIWIFISRSNCWGTGSVPGNW